MNSLSNIQKWSSLPSAFAFCIILVAAFALAQPTRAQDASLSGVGRELGLARALVLDVRDPEAAGRIKVKSFEPSGAVEEWAHVTLPLGGNQTGLWALPAVGDEVIIGFERGDVRDPIVIGSVWDGKLPPTSTK